MIDDRRSQLRSQTDEPAILSFGGANMSCTVINISPLGAAIEVPDPDGVPRRFVLLIKKDRQSFNCRMAWSRDNLVGVEFIPSAQPAVVVESIGA